MKVTPGSSRPIDGVIVDWWAPPSGASVMPDGVPAMTKRAPGVAPVDERVQTAAHERVVDRADRQQRLRRTGPRTGRAGRAAGRGSSREMPSSMCWPARALGPAQHGSSRPVPLLAGAKTPALLMKPARLVEVATSGAVVTRYGATPGPGTARPGPGRTPPGSRSAWCCRGCRSRRARSTGRPAVAGSRCSSSRRGCTRCPPAVAGVEPVPLGRLGQAQAASAARRSAWASAARSGCAGCPRSAAPSP